MRTILCVAVALALSNASAYADETIFDLDLSAYDKSGQNISAYPDYESGKQTMYVAGAKFAERRQGV